jgi:hypothetical protein
MVVRSDEFDLAIISDLHLSEGRDPVTKKFDLNEDFAHTTALPMEAEVTLRDHKLPVDHGVKMVVHCVLPLDFIAAFITRVFRQRVFREYCPVPLKSKLR